VEFYKVLALRTVGNFLILSSLFLIGKTFLAPLRAEIGYFADRQLGRHYLVVGDKEKERSRPKIKKGLLAKALNFSQVKILKPQDPYFDIIIPKIGANARIIANVNPADEKAYLKALKKGVAHTLGTAFPGQGGHIFLFAHSTDYIWNVDTYNAVFYLLYKLKIGDEIDLFYRGQRYVYRMTGRKIVNPSQVEYLMAKSNKEFLTLQTCWPPGTTLKRLLVFAVRVRD